MRRHIAVDKSALNDKSDLSHQLSYLFCRERACPFLAPSITYTVPFYVIARPLAAVAISKAFMPARDCHGRKRLRNDKCISVYFLSKLSVKYRTGA